ncbi:MAG: DUF4138 domain-containing protein [Bacteroidetes bacterium]|nr:DUF4138 domain-containing protein [Bacteroidota bacterium]
MTRIIAILAGVTLLGQMSPATAQTGVVRNKGMEHFLSTVLRSTPPASSESPPPIHSGGADPRDAEGRIILFRTSCERIIKEGSWISYGNDRSGKMKLQLRGIYTQGSVLYFLIRLKNRSSLDYDIEGIHFYVIAPPGRKSTVVRYGELLPVYVYDSSAIVRGFSHNNNVIVVPRFTLPAGRRLVIEVLEKNGGRHLHLLAGNFMLERARIL